MTYELKFTSEGKILRVEIFGERPRDQLKRASKEAWCEISRVASEKGMENLLIISYATGDYPTTKAYQINSTLAENGVQKGWKIAFVNIDAESYRDVKFAETVAVNRGFRVGVFRDEKGARKWLSLSD